MGYWDKKDNRPDVTAEDHDAAIKTLNESHDDELRDIRIDRADENRRAVQKLEDVIRASEAQSALVKATNANEIAQLKSINKIALEEASAKLLLTPDERVSKAEDRATKAETEVAVLTKTVELMGKTEDVGADVIEAVKILGHVQNLTEKIIEKLPNIDINTISIQATPSNNQQKGDAKNQPTTKTN